ncbi:MAG: DMT family transporter [Bdellovibrionales bacterium]|nr:DMT family transporter [Bdellovibrionales bacterium]
MNQPTQFCTVSLRAMLGYSLQSTLMTSFYRSIDRLSAVSYRGLSLGMTMAPLLLFVPGEQFSAFPSVLGLVLLASLAAALGNWAAASAFSYLPVGVASALSMSFATLFVVLLGAVLFDEHLSSPQLLLIAALLVGVIALGCSKTTGRRPEEFNLPRGFGSCLLFGVFLGTGYTIIGAASRQSHPFLVGYTWEFTIGLVALALSGWRRGFRAPLQWISFRRFGILALYSAPTVLGTGAYALAMTLGPIGIATAIIGTMMVSNTVLAMFLFGERPTRRQWAILLAVCLCVGMLRYVSAAS